MPRSNSTKEASEGGATVLVVDASTLIRLAICEYLRECMYKVFEAADGDEALAILQADHIQLDVMLADVEVPGSMDGFGLAQWVRTNRPGVKILLAGTVQKAAKVAADLCDAGPLLEKPYDHQLLTDRIKAAPRSFGAAQIRSEQTKPRLNDATPFVSHGWTVAILSA